MGRKLNHWGLHLTKTLQIMIMMCFFLPELLLPLRLFNISLRKYAYLFTSWHEFLRYKFTLTTCPKTIANFEINRACFYPLNLRNSLKRSLKILQKQEQSRASTRWEGNCILVYCLIYSKLLLGGVLLLVACNGIPLYVG